MIFLCIFIYCYHYIVIELEEPCFCRFAKFRGKGKLLHSIFYCILFCFLLFVYFYCIFISVYFFFPTYKLIDLWNVKNAYFTLLYPFLTHQYLQSYYKNISLVFQIYLNVHIYLISVSCFHITSIPLQFTIFYFSSILFIYIFFFSRTNIF